jgi:hypothetical protein
MIPSIGRIVHYRLSETDAEQVQRRRTTGREIASRIALSEWPLGAQAHIGADVAAGDLFPMLIVRVSAETHDAMVNGQVFLDGCDVLWVQAVPCGEEPGTYRWPTLTFTKSDAKQVLSAAVSEHAGGTDGR